MVGDNKGKKLKAADKNDEENAEQIDGELVLSIEKLQEIQDELEKVPSFLLGIYLSVWLHRIVLLCVLFV